VLIGVMIWTFDRKHAISASPCVFFASHCISALVHTATPLLARQSVLMARQKPGA
jgi:hypothetical protein